MKDYIIYDSSEYPDHHIKLKIELFLLPNAYGATEKLLSKSEVVPSNVRIYNNEEYCSMEISSLDKETDEQIHKSILNPDLRNKYSQIRTQLTIYPNDKDEKFALVVADILFFNQIKIDNRYLSNLYFYPPNAYMHSDVDQDIVKEKIGFYLGRNELTYDERQFLLDETIEKQKEHIDAQPTKKGFFKSFMSKSEDEPKNEKKFVMSANESKIFNMDALKIVNGDPNPEEKLDSLIGLENVKVEIKKLKAKLEYKKRREKRGIKDETDTNLHMCFLGSPGTGKTTVARIMTGLLYNLGYIKENKCIEIGANELKGGFTGQTAIKTKAILRNAKNKILFIDEAYSLFDKGGDGFGKEALEVILKEMEDNKKDLIIIFAGYQKEMLKMLNSNDGLKSRINRYINFENYSTLEMSQIYLSFLTKKKLYIDKDALEKSMILFKNAELKDRFSNGRFARNLLEKVEEEHAFNVRNEKDTQRRDTIKSEDISVSIIQELLTQSM